jgi:hypothetical protein
MIDDVVDLQPDESITDAMGRGHSLGTAVADIIDNALDADAERVLVTFVVENDHLRSVRIRDDGGGMTQTALIGAMTLGHPRARGSHALGHFGIGLKAASLSQAKTLTVFTQSANEQACALRIERGSFKGHILNPVSAREGLTWDARGPASTGTVVEWSELETANYSRVATERRAWLNTTISSLAETLGLAFHRLIHLRGIRITIEVFDRGLGLSGPPRTVEPRDPFNFSTTGHSAYPATISAATADGAVLAAECFVLPPRSDSPSAWLLGKNPVDWQGLYVYRNDRLLQAGGWLDIRPFDKRMRLARVRIELTPELERHLRLRHEKNGVTATPEFSAALESASAPGGITLDSYRLDASDVLKKSNARVVRIKPAVPVSAGLPDRVIEAVQKELGENDAEPIEVTWQILPDDLLFELRLEGRQLVLNLGYRAALGGEDSTLFATLSYLLLESHFTKGWLGAGTRAQIDAVQKVALAALLAQFGDSAYDLLAEWDAPARTLDRSKLPASDGMPTTGNLVPRPTPPSVPLVWAHLGGRGEIRPVDTALGASSLEELPGDAKLQEVELLGVEVESATSGPVAAPVDAGANPEEPLVDGALGYAMHASEEKADGPAPPAKTGSEVRRSSLPPIKAQPGDREIVAHYRTGADLEAIALSLGCEPRQVAVRLSALLLSLEGADIDDERVAAMHGLPYNPEERERLLDMFRSGMQVRRIAETLMRTPFAIAWQLLSSPKRPVEVPRSLLRRIDKALRAEDAPR